MIRPVSIKALPNYRIYISFSDGEEGEVDFGIIIKMYFDDHPPPHFHAEYAEHEGR